MSAREQATIRRRPIKTTVDKAVVSAEWILFTKVIANRFGQVVKDFGRHRSNGSAYLAVFLGEGASATCLDLDILLNYLPPNAEINKESFPLRVIAGK